jgi:UDP-GlcNAc3NAcA epimerase
VPCIIVREETEWVELIEKGMNVIIKPFEVKSAFTDIKRFIRNNEGSYNRNLYGLGNTSEKIIDIILKNYNI